MNHPEIIVKVDDILDSFDHGTKWVQGNWSSDEGHCLHQGVRMCQPQKGDAYLIEQVAKKQGWSTDWNDADGRTYDDIKQALVKHREIFPDELEETFGPNWQRVAVIVRSAATLTDSQVDQLEAAWGAAWDAARYAAREAAGEAAQHAALGAALGAARIAIRGAARIAIRDAAGYAAGNAASAVCTYDLIGQHGYTQNHYDTLVGPWETVMGTEATR